MTAPEPLQVIDIAEYAASGKAPPKGQKYRFMLDKQSYVSEKAELTGAEILAFGQLDPNRHNLFQANHGGQRVPISPAATVDLSEPGIERFFTMKNEHNNGDGSGRREYELPEEDLAFLATLGLPWEAFVVGPQRWLVIHDWPILEGFNTNRAFIALRIDPNYPMAQIDMAYFHPALSLAGREIPSLAMIEVEGQQWQQWSRHRPSDGWRPGIDSLESHLAYVDNFLATAVASP